MVLQYRCFRDIQKRQRPNFGVAAGLLSVLYGRGDFVDATKAKCVSVSTEVKAGEAVEVAIFFFFLMRAFLYCQSYTCQKGGKMFHNK